QRLFLLRAAQATADIEIGLALVATQVQHLERAEILVGRLELTLHTDQALACGMDGELAEVAGDPLAAKLFSNGGGGAGAPKEIGDQVALVATGFNDAFEQGLRLLGGVLPCCYLCGISLGNVRGNFPPISRNAVIDIETFCFIVSIDDRACASSKVFVTNEPAFVSIWAPSFYRAITRGKIRFVR